MYSIMIVDDEEAIHQAIKVIGDWKKYQVTQILDAYNGQEALDLLHENLVDLVFLDIKMPKIGGLEFIERLKKLTLSPRVIIISGYNDFEYLQFAIRAGIEDYLLKPINRHEFGETMERTMENLKKDRLIRTQVELDKITSEPLLTECFLKQLIYSRGDLLKEREKFDEYIVHQEDNCCRVVQIYISNFDKIAQFMFEGDSYSAYKAMCDTVNKESDSIKKICSFRDDMQWNTIIAVIIYEKRKFTGKLNSLG